MRLLGSLLLGFGAYLAYWVFRVLSHESLHMGSPLRVSGHHAVEAAGQAGPLVQSILNTGSLGFDLLGQSLALIAISSVTFVSLGFVMLVRSHLMPKIAVRT